ncbi:SURF1 family protein [Donghicola sp. C2-DW-16]|uniref:SURF1-like protein n=1 Tax=Donghicola mangrovi TaxID=2729614 RepID=A0A850Q5Q3_9RHOB|nr:SURF1 family protein [Donghicola mangrovi]NVO24283.1 SURF1 family protein [Donghicola mangrovi]NVO28411.1 SURF1 family protein [Donghicola mangrovi]
MRRSLLLIPIGIVVAVILLGLGKWQMDRLAWKTRMLADIEAHITQAPVAVPVNPDPVRDRYLPVTASGTITEDELHVLASARGQGAGYRIITAFETDEGRRLMLDRGFVAIEAKTDTRPAHHATVVANLHWPDERNGSTPDNDVARNDWFSRDILQMAQALNAEPILLVLRSSDETEPRVTPWPVDTSGIPNNHLEYAVTWFSFAAIWIIGIGYLLWRDRRANDERPE